MPDADLEQNYVGAFDGKLRPGKKPALLLVDMVEAYLQPDSPLYCEMAAAAADAATELLTAARSANRPVIFTNVTYQPGGADGGLFYRKVPALKMFEIGNPLGAFPNVLKPREGEHVISKQYPSAFFGTDLDENLKSLGIDTLVIAGYSTSGCVRASVLDALQYGFAPFVAEEACADRHTSPHESNLFDMQAKYAEVVTLADAVEILSSA